MMAILSLLGYVLLAVLAVIVFMFLVVGLKFVTWFYLRHCKHCHHTMDYKGEKEDDNNGHYLFHCPKCGAWEQVTKEQFVREWDKDCDPNTL
jgi:peptide subunit release factor 1 (eRF1)